MENPRVSVIIPCYRQGAFLPTAVASVLAQTAKDWEIVIVNDGSPDDTAQVARALIAAHPEVSILLIEQENQGAAAARNSGIQASQGLYLLPLDADDTLKPGAIEVLAGVLDANPAVDIAYPDLEFSGARSGVFHAIPDEQIATRLLVDTLPPCSMFRRSIWQRVGGYKAEMRAYEDWDFWLSALEQGACFRHVDGAYYVYQIHDSVQASLYRQDENLSVWFARLIQNHARLLPPMVVEMANTRLSGLILNEDVYRYAHWVILETQRMRDLLVILARYTLAAVAPGGVAIKWNEELLELFRTYEVALEAGYPEQGREALRQALERMPDDAYFITAWGKLELEAGNLENARRSFMKVTALVPVYLPAYLYLAQTFERLGRLDHAEAVLEPALRAYPQYLDALRLKAHLLVVQGKFGEAMGVLMAWLRLAPQEWGGWLMMAQVAEKVGETDQAKKLYQRVLQMNPANLEAQQSLVRIG